MNKIQVMDQDLANKIAAGEVVEKTMNVVKELVENAIDAKSTEIKVELIDSGVKEIKITDNGMGMNHEDACLAFERHATSKLKTLEDLFHIDSLGFRGEALPSIAAVSQVVLKTSNGEEGTEVVIHGGKKESIESSDIRKGTSITVKELFYNTPVRLKYLKNLYSELANITEYIHKMALSYPNIKFLLKNNDKLLLNTDGSGRLLKVIHDIYGLSVTKKMIEINSENDDYKIQGYISYPELMKSNRNSITTLVNGRVIKNNELNRIITDSYHTYMPQDKFPIAVILIDVDPILIDVNVHPTKMDIKFSKLDSLKEIITGTIKKQLESLSLIPDIATQTVVTGNDTKIMNHYSTYQTEGFDVEKKEAEFQEFEKMSLELEVREEQSSYEKEETDPVRMKEIYPVGLVHGTYIIAENEDGMFLIDQHAANERINYEYYLEAMSNPISTQMDLLIPIFIELPTNEFIIIKEHFDFLQGLGFLFEEFGWNTLAIRSVPMWLPKGREEASIRQILDILSTKESFSLERFIDHVAATVACKASIKANDFITLDDMRTLLSRLRLCKNPFTCPHGRPTIITYSSYELEKMFKRAAV